METTDTLIQDRIRYLRENTDFVSAVFDSLVGYAITAADFDGNIIAYNEGARQIFGYAPEEVIGRENINIFFPEEFIAAGRFEGVVSELLEKGRVAFEGEMVRKDGSRFPAHKLFTLTRDKIGQIVGFVEIVQELTLQKQAEELVKESEARFRRIIESNADGMLIVDKNGIIRFVNPAAEALFVRPEKELLGSHFGFPTASGERTEVEIVRPATHRPIVAEMRVADIEWQRQKAYLATLRDITDRKEASDALNKMNEELKKIDTMKSDFISIASHELRTPLTSIKNAVDIILKGKAGAITDGQGKFLSMAQRNINRLSALINDMLNISKIESGKMNYEYDQMDIKDIIGNAMNMLQPLANKKSIALQLDISPDLPVIFGDANKIEQVLINLVGNAIKFTPEQGAVTIAVHQKEAVSDMPEEATGYVEIAVADTGIGIPEEHKGRLFEKFYQAKHSLARQEQSGTGLGLAICKGIVEGHKGKIWYESTEGKGSTFHFSLPVFSPQTIEATVLEKTAVAYLNSPLYSLLEVNFDQEALTNLNLQAPGAVEKLRCQLIDVIREGIHRDGDRIIFNPISCGLVVILDKTPKEKAMTVRKNLEDVLSRRPIFFEGALLAVPTISEPVTFPADGETMEELLAAVKKRRIESL